MERCFNSLLPNNVEKKNQEKISIEEKRKLASLNFKEVFLKPKDNYKNKNIKPKYFFSIKVLKKLDTLRDIFIEFDKDNSGIFIYN